MSLVIDADTMPHIVQEKQTNPAIVLIIGDTQHITIGIGENPSILLL
jgi:hypothetical protein